MLKFEDITITEETTADGGVRVTASVERKFSRSFSAAEVGENLVERGREDLVKSMWEQIYGDLTKKVLKYVDRLTKAVETLPHENRSQMYALLFDLGRLVSKAKGRFKGLVGNGAA